MEKKNKADQPAVSNWTMEVVASIAIMLIGIMVVIDSQRMGGATWTSDGPGSGYFPFFVGLIITVASAAVLVQTLIKNRADLGSFISTEKLRSVSSVLLPTILYVAVIKLLGIYVSSTIFIAGFMWWFGKYGWLKIIPVSVSINILFFLTFEKWFLIPLPKGPLEKLFGY